MKVKIKAKKKEQVKPAKLKDAPVQFLVEDNTDWAVARRKTLMRYQSFHV